MLGYRTQPLRKKSASRCAITRAQRRAYQQAGESCCRACGSWQQVEHSHILTQKMHPAHRNDPRNWVMLCREDHATWENNKALFKERFPEVWAHKLAMMELLEPGYYELFKHKHRDLFP